MWGDWEFMRKFVRVEMLTDIGVDWGLLGIMVK